MKLVLGVLWMLHWLPLPILGRLGKALGTLLFYSLKGRRHITLTNLRLCFPDKSEAERHAIAREHFQLFARSALERSILWWASESRLQKLMVIEPALPLETFKTEPVIILCPHFVCLDVAGAAIAMQISACSMYSPQKNQAFDAALLKGRGRFKPQRLVTRREGIKPILRALRDRHPYFMLPDMDFGLQDAEFIPFFGHPAATLTALPRLAAAARAKVIPVVATFLPDYRGWKVTFYPPWEDYPGEDITVAARRMNAFIEARVRELPADYFWAHRRFKTRPAGEAGVY
ncbi:MAG: lipid A biosynthesis acyltransferase [Oxalobacter sp.]|nr:MAG: lipid A biosynthesis acyltransferase [Oxalobacter sp.]